MGNSHVILSVGTSGHIIGVNIIKAWLLLLVSSLLRPLEDPAGQFLLSDIK